MLIAAAAAARQEGVAGVNVAEIVRRSGVSRRTFYEVFADRDECLLATLDEALARARASVVPVYSAESGWREAVRAGLGAFLSFLDEEPVLGTFLVVDSLGAGPIALELRSRAIERVVDAVDRGRTLGRAPRSVSRLTAEGLVGAVLAIVHSRLLEADGKAAISSLLGQLAGIVVLPYLGPSAAAREIAEQASPAPHGEPVASDAVLRDLGIRLTYRTTLVLSAIATHPGASNREVAEHAGITDQGQISKLLARLAKAGLLENQAASSRGERYAWLLTRRGSELERAVRVV